MYRGRGTAKTFLLRGARAFRATFVASCLLACAGSFALAAESSLRISSDPGDFVGLGKEYTLTSADGDFTVHGAPSYVLVTFNSHSGSDSWTLFLVAPTGAVLAAGPYFDAVSPGSLEPGTPTLSVGGNSHGCPSHGAFIVKRLEFGSGGSIAALWVTFDQACDGSAAALRGELRLNVDPDVALTAPIDVSVEKGLPITFGVAGADRAGLPVNLRATGLPPGAQFVDGGDGRGSLAWLTPFTGIDRHDLQFTAESDSGQDHATTRIEVTGISSIFLDGLPITPRSPSSQVLLTPAEGHIWGSAHDGFVSVFFQPPFPGSSVEVSMGAPEGARLAPGTYADATPGWQPGHPLLSWACTDGEARFEVIEVQYSPGGNLLALHATFESRCPDRPATYRGEVRYRADVPFLLRAPARIVGVEERESAFVMRAFDVSGGAAAIDAGPLPAGATFVDHGDSTGTFRWIPSHGQAGFHAVTFTAAGGDRRDVVPTVFDVRLRNDEFDDALPITALPFEDRFVADPATSADDDPVCGTPTGSGTVWYDLALPGDATVELSTFGSRGAVRLAVYEGARGALRELACDFDRVTLSARAGVTYHILLRTVGRMTVRFTASVPPPPPANDDFDSALVIDALPFTTEVRTDAATRASDDPSCVASGKTIWYSWTSPGDLWVVVDPSGSEFETSASVWTGSRGALAPVTCSGSRGSFHASPGATYYFMLGAVEDIIGGHVVLNVTATPAYRIDLALDRTGDYVPRSGNAIISGTVTCTASGFVHVTGLASLGGAHGGPDVAFESWVECTQPVHFTAELGGGDVRLRPGWVEVQVRAEGYEPTTGQAASDSVTTRVRLAPGRGSGSTSR